jgi:hypothetical protein
MNGYMTEHVIVKKLRPTFMARGYSRKGANWYRHQGRVTTAVFIGPSTKQVVVQLGRFDRTLHWETHPSKYDALELVGMSALVPDHDEWNASRMYDDWALMLRMRTSSSA